MNKLQKIAVLNLSLATAGLFLELLRILTQGDLRGVRIVISTIKLIICSGLVASYVFRVKFVKRAPYYDERDRFICKRALLAGLLTLFFVIFAASMISFMAVGPSGAINIGSLLAILMLGGMSCIFAESVAILVQYGLGGNENE